MKRRWMKCGKYKINNPLLLLLLLLLPHVQLPQTAQVVEYTRRELGELVVVEPPFHEKNKRKRGGDEKKVDEMWKIQNEQPSSLFFSFFFPTYK